MFGWIITTGSVSSASMSYFLPIRGDIMNGTVRMAVMQTPAAVFAFQFHENILPSESDIISPKIPRLVIHIHSDPPRVPVNSYHWTAHIDRAKELPSTSHGHEISASK